MFCIAQTKFYVDKIVENENFRGMQSVWGVECRIVGFGRNTRVKIPLWRFRRIWDDNNNIVLQELECDITHWIELSQVM